MTNPKLSVVMSVYNGAEVLPDTINSVLSQTFDDFEFIIINDGSNDDSQSVLERFGKLDSRIKVIEQENTGLTTALANGCKLAKGELVARHDNGDRSLETRFAKQVEAFNSTPQLVISSTGTTFIGPHGEYFNTIKQSLDGALNGLKADSIDELEGPPHHGSVMFRRSTYESVGGYRSEFIVAQDIDLWSRMVELGEHRSITDVLYHAGVDKSSISFTKRDHQFQTAKLIIECIRARKRTEPEAPILVRLKKLNEAQSKLQLISNQSSANYYYFLGSSLANKDIVSSRRYLRKALKENPLHWRALIKLLSTLTGLR